MMLKGNKISLRKATEEDALNIVRWRNQDFIKKNFIVQATLTVEGHLKWMKENVETGHVVQMIIIENETNDPIGSVYLRDIDYNEKTAEYGIFIGEKRWQGKGYGSEACKMICDYAKEKMGLQKLFLRLKDFNIPALKSYENAGFVLTGEYEYVNDEKIIFMEKIL